RCPLTYFNTVIYNKYGMISERSVPQMSDADSTLRQSAWGKVFQKLITCTVYTLFRPKIIWEDKALKKQLKEMPAVFVANHTHHFDGAFLGAVLGRYKPYVLVSKNWYDKKGVGTMIKWCRCMPIDLGGADAEWYITAEQYIRNGGSMIIFPEGGIARSGKIEQFKAGASLLSASTGATVIPVAVYGEYDMVFGKRQKIIIGKAIESCCPEDMRHSRYAKLLAKQSEDEVKRLYGIMEQKYGKLPVYEESYIEQ
ncbi:MAG: 1-acyl-sn-glycerol-3-phosphate acyltransferase, partial [Ruminococcaceae bacterium]|nr:1-acyl-sn-glycerol-3-phosphate acyltransferase [Oscillospiraceae bacterium]